MLNENIETETLLIRMLLVLRERLGKSLYMFCGWNETRRKWSYVLKSHLMTVSRELSRRGYPISGFPGIYQSSKFGLTTLNEDTLMLRPAGLTHLKDYVLETRRLGGGPVNSSYRRRRRYVGHINNEISDLSVEDVCAAITSIACTLVGVCIDNSQTAMEVGQGPQNRGTIRIAYKLGLIVIDLYCQNAKTNGDVKEKGDSRSKRITDKYRRESTQPQEWW